MAETQFNKRVAARIYSKTEFHEADGERKLIELLLYESTLENDSREYRFFPKLCSKANKRQ